VISGIKPVKLVLFGAKFKHKDQFKNKLEKVFAILFNNG